MRGPFSSAISRVLVLLVATIEVAILDMLSKPLAMIKVRLSTPGAQFSDNPSAPHLVERLF